MENLPENTTSTEITNYQGGNAAAGLSASDIQIPRVQICQAMSEVVTDMKFQPGDIIDGQMEELLGSKSDKPIEFIIVDSFKYCSTYVKEKGKKKFEYKDRFPVLNFNEIPFEKREFEDENGIPTQYHMNQSFYVLITSQMDDGFAMPYELTLRGANIKHCLNGLNTILFKMGNRKMDTWDKTFFLTSQVDQNKDGDSWWGARTKLGRDTKEPERQMALDMYLSLHPGITNMRREKYTDEQILAAGYKL